MSVFESFLFVSVSPISSIGSICESFSYSSFRYRHYFEHRQGIRFTLIFVGRSFLGALGDKMASRTAVKTSSGITAIGMAVSDLLAIAAPRTSSVTSIVAAALSIIAAVAPIAIEVAASVVSTEGLLVTVVLPSESINSLRNVLDVVLHGLHLLHHALGVGFLLGVGIGVFSLLTLLDLALPFRRLVHVHEHGTDVSNCHFPIFRAFLCGVFHLHHFGHGFVYASGAVLVELPPVLGERVGDDHGQKVVVRQFAASVWIVGASANVHVEFML